MLLSFSVDSIMLAMQCGEKNEQSVPRISRKIIWEGNDLDYTKSASSFSRPTRRLLLKPSLEVLARFASKATVERTVQ